MIVGDIKNARISVYFISIYVLLLTPEFRNILFHSYSFLIFWWLLDGNKQIKYFHKNFSRFYTNKAWWSWWKPAIISFSLLLCLGILSELT
jgi:hypothetical protein